MAGPIKQILDIALPLIPSSGIASSGALLTFCGLKGVVL